MEQVWTFELDDITDGCVSEAWLHNFKSVCHIGFYEWIEDVGFEDFVCESDGRVIESVVDEDNGQLHIIANFDMECALYEDCDDEDDDEDSDDDDYYDADSDEDDCEND